MTKQITALKQAAIKKQEDTFARTNLAIEKMISDDAIINFEQVSLNANISKSWLYNQPKLCKRIKSLRQHKRGKSLNNDVVQDYENTIADLKAKLKRLESKLEQRDKQIEVAYGEWFERKA